MVTAVPASPPIKGAKKRDFDNALVIPLDLLRKHHVGLVGGKSSSLGEMIGNLGKKGVRVPGGFSTTANAYRRFLEENGIFDQIHNLLATSNISKPKVLARVGKKIRGWIMAAKFSDEFVQAVSQEIQCLRSLGITSVAVRSSATAEDLPDASFAGQQETILNVPLELGAVLSAIKKVVASLFGDRAIFYREENNFAHEDVSLCACVQTMVRSDKAVAGVMFSCDSDSGHNGVVGITAVYGLGELAVGGANTDEYITGRPPKKGDPIPVLLRRIGRQKKKMVFLPRGKKTAKGHFTKLVPITQAERSRFRLSQEELEELTHFAMIIEEHYGCPMDMEWAKNGKNGLIFITQARPVTVNKNVGKVIERYVPEPGSYTKLLSGLAIGNRIASGRVRILKNSSPTELGKIQKGDILVAKMTDPNYVPAMKRAAAILTEEGSSKCHAAIIARELKKAAIVACPGALTKLRDGQMITICCAEGTTGNVYQGEMPFEVKVTKIGKLVELNVKLKMNVGDPGQALQAAMLPNRGVGLARQEFIIANTIGIHPQACLDYKKLPEKLRKKIDKLIVGYKDPVEFYVRKLAEGIAMIVRAFYPHRVVIRLSDFKTNEYRDLIGGKLYEPKEANPMIGYRGACRYLDEKFRRCFELECQALRIVREEMGLTNFDIMVPFVRTLDEGRAVTKLLAKNGLVSSSGKQGMRIGMMCEVPSNVILAREFAKIFDFASIGSNDLHQLVTGTDRDSGMKLSDERDPAVRLAIAIAIQAWRKAGKPIGICGQAPSDHKGYAEFLDDLGISSMSLNPDSIVQVWKRLEKRIPKSKLARMRAKARLN